MFGRLYSSTCLHYGARGLHLVFTPDAIQLVQGLNSLPNIRETCISPTSLPRCAYVRDGLCLPSGIEKGALKADGCRKADPTGFGHKG